MMRKMNAAGHSFQQSGALVYSRKGEKAIFIVEMVPKLRWGKKKVSKNII